ncbi:hypothetical protein CAC42_7472 [Sphaceloma murrayae]|uniref:Uncharacterized protein n=1 Tax=Sphaceloma murrayae TaxID=2082308 RepID=A0A2K1QX44_9PEZI|nr:hypothetical protein CAC42_7472 [Sphaceloma murrayae]
MSLVRFLSNMQLRWKTVSHPHPDLPFRFLDLPPEVRSMTYPFLLPGRGQYTIYLGCTSRARNGYRVTWRLIGPEGSRPPTFYFLASSCKTIYTDAIAMLYHTFHVEIGALDRGKGFLPALTRAPMTSFFHTTHSLTLFLPLADHTAETLTRTMETFEWGRQLVAVTVMWRVIKQNTQVIEQNRKETEKLLALAKQELTKVWKKIEFPGTIAVRTEGEQHLNRFQRNYGDDDFRKLMLSGENERRAKMGINVVAW